MAILVFIGGLVLLIWGSNLKAPTTQSLDTMTAIEYSHVKRKMVIRRLMLVAGVFLVVMAVVFLMAGIFVAG